MVANISMCVLLVQVDYDLSRLTKDRVMDRGMFSSVECMYAHTHTFTHTHTHTDTHSNF